MTWMGFFLVPPRVDWEVSAKVLPWVSPAPQNLVQWLCCLIHLHGCYLVVPECTLISSPYSGHPDSSLGVPPSCLPHAGTCFHLSISLTCCLRSISRLPFCERTVLCSPHPLSSTMHGSGWVMICVSCLISPLHR